jgi:hypothetical protein
MVETSLIHSQFPIGATFYRYNLIKISFIYLTIN